MSEMPTSDGETTEQIIGDIRRMGLRIAQEFESELKLSPGFVQAVLDDPSDWSFVVKMLAFIEAALSQAIASRFDSPQLQEHLARLPFEGRTGKLQLASDLGLVGKAGARRLRALASLRNAFAHDVQMMQISLTQHVSRLDKSDKIQLANVLLGQDAPRKQISLDDFDVANARPYVSIAACLAVAELARAYRDNANARRWQEARGLLGDAMLAQLGGEAPESREKLVAARQVLAEVVRGPTDRATPAKSSEST